MQAASANWNPRVMIGANAVSLNSQDPSPVYRPSTVAVELAPGIGFALDGESLVIDDKIALGTTTMTGHLDDGSYKDRDRVVVHQGSSTQIQGAYDWQGYALERKGSDLAITCGDPDFSSVVTQNGQSLSSQGRFPAQQYTVTSQGNVTHVQGFEPQRSADVVFCGDKVQIKGSDPENSFEISRTDKGFHVQGYYRFQDFDVTLSAHGLTVDGLYPTQHYVISQATA